MTHHRLRKGLIRTTRPAMGKETSIKVSDEGKRRMGRCEMGNSRLRFETGRRMHGYRREGGRD